MNLVYKYSLALFICWIGITSCSKDQSAADSNTITSTSTSLLPYSTGKISTIYLYHDKSSEVSSFKDSLLFYLNQPYLLTPNLNPAVDITNYSFENFQEGKARTANNLIVANMKEDSNISQYVNERLGKGKVESLLQDKQFVLIRVEDVNATPQQVFYLLTNGLVSTTSEASQKRLNEYAKTIIDEVTKLDNKRLVNNYKEKQAVALEDIANEKFGVNMWIPRTYNLVLEEDNFAWFINETPELYSNITLYKAPFNPEFELEKQVLAIRDEMGKKIVTHKEDTRMTTNIENRPYPIQRELEIDSVKVLETRGLWEIVNDVMGGGFVNYAFVNQQNEIVLIDGFVFYTENDKRRKMRDIDAIFSTIQLEN